MAYITGENCWYSAWKAFRSPAWQLRINSNSVVNNLARLMNRYPSLPNGWELLEKKLVTMTRTALEATCPLLIDESHELSDEGGKLVFKTLCDKSDFSAPFKVGVDVVSLFFS